MGKKLTLGSLFDGSGGFPFGGLLCGIEPVWASEVEPFPIRVTTKRLPHMLHLGDINFINGAAVPPVDIITGGFPCQNLSVAGQRAGLFGNRSSLFFQMARVIREMRIATGGTQPRFVVVENVPGMYSSNKGQDFREVLNELVQIKDSTLHVPMPEKGKWLGVGEIVGDNFSLAWRTLDAQFWGVPQRRRRCFVVLDFDGERAGEVLFDEARLCGNYPQGNLPWQNTAGYPTVGAGNAGGERSVIGFEPGAASRLGGHCWDNLMGTLNADAGDNLPAVVYDARGNGDGRTVNTMAGDHENRVTDYTALAVMPKVYGICSQGSNSMKSGNPHSGVYEMEASRTLDTGACSGNGGTVVVMEGNGMRPSHKGSGICTDVSPTLNTVENHAVCYEESSTYAMTAGCYTQICKEQSPTLQARDYKDAPLVSHGELVVRRLTPKEAALLQGFPIDWCDGLETMNPTEADISFWAEVWEIHRKVVGKAKKPKSRSQIIKWLKKPYSDSAEYRLWGNGVALPCVVFVLGGIAHLCNKAILDP